MASALLQDYRVSERGGQESGAEEGGGWKSMQKSGSGLFTERLCLERSLASTTLSLSLSLLLLLREEVETGFN